MSRSGQSALLLVEEEPRPGPERALILHLLTGDQIVREKALRPRIAILDPVQVRYNLIEKPKKFMSSSPHNSETLTAVKEHLD